MAQNWHKTDTKMTQKLNWSGIVMSHKWYKNDTKMIQKWHKNEWFEIFIEFSGLKKITIWGMQRCHDNGVSIELMTSCSFSLRIDWLLFISVCVIWCSGDHQFQTICCDESIGGQSDAAPPLPWQRWRFSIQLKGKSKSTCGNHQLAAGGGKNLGHKNDTKMTLKWHKNDTKMTLKWHKYVSFMTLKRHKKDTKNVSFMTQKWHKNDTSNFSFMTQ